MFDKWILKPVLGFFSRIYGMGLKIAQAPYEKAASRRKVKAWVISIGNITWGGTGKTPLVMMLARCLSSRGKKIAVLTRGYGNDETFELKNGLSGVPILVGKNRIKTAQEAVDKHQAEVVLLDDGFQHLGLARDCDVVAINATNPFGNGELLPMGNLREPLAHLARADVFVITKASLGKQNVNLIRQRLKETNPRALVFEADHEPVRFMDFAASAPMDLDRVKGKKVAILSGIEDPLSFERILCKLGAVVVLAARFDDHHAFTAAEMKEVFRSAHELQAEYLITTAKDHYRLGRVLKHVDMKKVRILALQIEIRMDDEESFIRRCANL